MPNFARSFAVDAVDGAKDSLVAQLFAHWALPGEACSESRRLRVGVRNGYLNFYAKGQSVAKLSVARGRPVLSVHRAYVEGQRGDRTDGTPPVQGYVTVAGDAAAGDAAGALLPGWIDTALSHASAEKRFVDDLIAANAGVIDLEMALPASDLPGHKRVAPRMDVVLVELAPRRPVIVFWEAKCANNPELRARDGVAPVVEQLGQYVDWMAQPGRNLEVATAYRQTATVLLDLARRFRPDVSAMDCLALWQSLAATDPDVMATPAVVIGNYWPDGHVEQIASGRMTQYVESFAKKGHAAKLSDAGIRFYEVAGLLDAALPTLSERT